MSLLRAQSALFLVAWLAILTTPASFALESRGTKAYAAGNYEEAELRYRADVQKMTRRAKRDRRFSQALSNLGNIYYMEGKMKLSEAVYRQLIPLDEEIYGSSTLHVADDLYALSRCLRRQNRWQDAEPVLLRVLEVRRKNLGECDKDVSRSWLDLAVNYQRDGKYPEAETAYKKAIHIRESLSDRDDMFLSPALRTYASLLYLMNRTAEADAMIKRADAINQPKTSVEQANGSATADGAVN